MSSNNEPVAPTAGGSPALKFDDFDPGQVLWYTLEADLVQKMVALASRKNGVKVCNVNNRRERLGSNFIPTGSGPSLLKIIFFNFVNSITAILAFVAVVSAVFGDWAAFGICLFVICFVGIVGAKQEWDAAASLEGLKNMTKGNATVIRDGKAVVISVDEVVVGDVVVLEQGTTVSCDCRIFESNNLEINETLLTGEALPVEKRAEAIPDPEKKCSLGDRINMGFRSTNVTAGRGKAIAVACGVKTEMGKLAAQLTDDAEDDLPQEAEKKKKLALAKQKKEDIAKGGKKEKKEESAAVAVEGEPATAGGGPKNPDAEDDSGLTREETALIEEEETEDKDQGAKPKKKGTKTELAMKMDKLMYAILAFCLLLVLIVFAVNKFNMTPSVIIYGAAVAIAILPQSLVAVIAVAMALSVRKMAAQQCIVRKLGSLEVLDRVTDICSDKTGTLTQNKMVVARVYVGDEDCQVLGQPMVNFAGFVRRSGDSKSTLNIDEQQEGHPRWFEFVRSAALCGTTVLVADEFGNLEGSGNPTEIAIQAMAHKAHAPRSKWEDEGLVSRGEYPFDSSIKRMSSSFYDTKTQKTVTFTKGAPERVLALCKWKMDAGADGALTDLTDVDRERIENLIESYADLGLRTICLSVRNNAEAETKIEMPDVDDKIGSFNRSVVESDLIYLGIVGIYDPPRVESKLSCNICKRAGITVRMLTGDHFATAAAIACEIDIITQEEKTQDGIVMKGPDFDKLTPMEAFAMNDLPRVVGRCSPDTKVRMIKELHRRGRICAMTGDGFNDSPSIKAADIGCAMGSGTDVTKGVADFVITDDNFSTIVKALAEGRRISLAISKFVTHLLCGNLGETIVLVCGLWVSQNGESVFILSPMQILWLNLFTSSPPAIGLSIDKAPEDVLRVGPNTKGTFSKELLIDTLVYGITMGALSLASFCFVLFGINSGVQGKECNRSVGTGCDNIWAARSTAYVVLYFCMLVHAYNVRFGRVSIFVMKKFDNPWLWGSFIFGIVSIVAMLYIPAIATNVFVHAPMSWEWGVVGVDLVIFIFVSEVYKMIKNKVDPLPVHTVTPEEARQEAALFRNELHLALGDETDVDDSRSTNEMASDNLAGSFVRQASHTSAL